MNKITSELIASPITGAYPSNIYVKEQNRLGPQYIMVIEPTWKDYYTAIDLADGGEFSLVFGGGSMTPEAIHQRLEANGFSRVAGGTKVAINVQSSC